MSVPREAAVQAATSALHTVYCLPGTSPLASWSPEHGKADARRAGQLVQKLLDSGALVLPVPEPSFLSHDVYGRV